MQFNIKNIVIIFLIILITYILLYNFLSYKEGLKVKRIGRAFKKVGKQIEKGVDKAAEEAKRAAERAAKEAKEQAKRVAEEAKKAAERAAQELEKLNFIKAFEKLFAAFGSLENIFTKFPNQLRKLLQDTTDFKKNTITGIQNII